MSYENPQLPQEVNVSRDNAVLEFLRLAAGLAVVVIAISSLLYFAGGRLARLIPFETERNWVGERAFGIDTAPGTRTDPALEAYLQALTDRLAAQMDLPPGMRLRAHAVDQPVPNAFASLGGHIAVTRGLYERLQSENALALVLAHEIAHIRARDPIAGIGGSATTLLALTLLTGNAGSLSTAFATVVQRGYSRQAETLADGHAIAAVKKLYGHAGGGASVFETFAAYHTEHGGQAPSLLSTHPLDAERIERLRQAAADWDPVRQPLRPLALPMPPPQ